MSNPFPATQLRPHEDDLFPSSGDTAHFHVLLDHALLIMRTATRPHRRNVGKPIPWDGPENVREIAAGSPPFADHLTLEGLAYHRERDRNPFAVLVTILLQLGLAQGIRLAQGTHRDRLVAALRARANGSQEPSNAEIEELYGKLEAGDVGPALPAQTGQVRGMLETKGPPYDEDELLEPWWRALLFAYTVDTGPLLDQAIRDVFELGIEQGRRLRKQNAKHEEFSLRSAARMLLRDSTDEYFKRSWAIIDDYFKATA